MTFKKFQTFCGLSLRAACGVFGAIGAALSLIGLMWFCLVKLNLAGIAVSGFIFGYSAMIFYGALMKNDVLIQMGLVIHLVVSVLIAVLGVATAGYTALSLFHDFTAQPYSYYPPPPPPPGSETTESPSRHENRFNFRIRHKTIRLLATLATLAILTLFNFYLNRVIYVFHLELKEKPKEKTEKSDLEKY